MTNVLRNFCMAGLFTLRVFAINLLRWSRRRNIFHISFFYDWPGMRTQAFASNKPTHYILDQGDLITLIHTYIIGHYNPSVRIIDLVSQFKVDSELQIILKYFSWQLNLFSEFLPEMCWEEIAEEIIFAFCFAVWPGSRTLDLHLILDYGDFKVHMCIYIKIVNKSS